MKKKVKRRERKKHCRLCNDTQYWYNPKTGEMELCPECSV